MLQPCLNVSFELEISSKCLYHGWMDRYTCILIAIYGIWIYNSYWKIILKVHVSLSWRVLFFIKESESIRLMKHGFNPNQKEKGKQFCNCKEKRHRYVIRRLKPPTLLTFGLLSYGEIASPKRTVIKSSWQTLKCMIWM